MIASIFLPSIIVLNRFFDFLDTSRESMYQRIDEVPYIGGVCVDSFDIYVERGVRGNVADSL